MKRGIFSFILYLICTALGGALFIYAKIEADRINNSSLRACSSVQAGESSVSFVFLLTLWLFSPL